MRIISIMALTGRDRPTLVVDDANYRASRMVRNVVGQVPIIDDRARACRTLIQKLHFLLRDT